MHCAIFSTKGNVCIFKFLYLPGSLTTLSWLRDFCVRVSSCSFCVSWSDVIGRSALTQDAVLYLGDEKAAFRGRERSYQSIYLNTWAPSKASIHQTLSQGLLLEYPPKRGRKLSANNLTKNVEGGGLICRGTNGGMKKDVRHERRLIRGLDAGRPYQGKVSLRDVCFWVHYTKNKSGEANCWSLASDTWLISLRQ